MAKHTECPVGLVALASTNLLVATIAAFGMMVVHELPGEHAGLATGAVLALLLVASAIGYLTQHRLARLAGNLYAVLAIVAAALGDVSGPIAIVALVYALYPLATLLLVNAAFRAHLAR